MSADSSTSTARDDARSAAELVVRAQAGDERAEALLCERLSPAIRAFARRRVRNEELVREFQQDVLLLFVESLRRSAIGEPARVGGFVLGICHNVALDRVRRRERRSALWDTYGATVMAFDTPEVDHATLEVLRLEDCLTGLSQRARDAVWLSYGEQRSHAEIAEHLGITEGNARVLRHRTLAALRECMSAPQAWEARG